MGTLKVTLNDATKVIYTEQHICGVSEVIVGLYRDSEPSSPSPSCAKKRGHTNVTVRTVDTDVVVIAVAKYIFLSKIWIELLANFCQRTTCSVTFAK